MFKTVVFMLGLILIGTLIGCSLTAEPENIATTVPTSIPTRPPENTAVSTPTQFSESSRPSQPVDALTPLLVETTIQTMLAGDLRLAETLFCPRMLDEARSANFRSSASVDCAETSDGFRCQVNMSTISMEYNYVVRDGKLCDAAYS